MYIYVISRRKVYAVLIEIHIHIVKAEEVRCKGYRKGFGLKIHYVKIKI